MCLNRWFEFDNPINPVKLDDLNEQINFEELFDLNEEFYLK
jgi:hypothetical protein